MSARGLAVLERFPEHLGATDPGKLLGHVVTELADPLDLLTRQVGDVRKAHRLAEAPARLDLLRLVALHGLGDESLALLAIRLDALEAADTDDAELIGSLLSLPSETIDELAAISPNTVSAAIARMRRHASRQAGERALFTQLIGAMRIGNATPAALLHTTGAYLGLSVERIVHTAGRWWHLAVCRDGIRLEIAPPPPTMPDLTPVADIIGLEENPFRSADIAPAAKAHGQRFRILRGGLEDVDVSVRVIGIGSRSVRPMVVHLEAGMGLVYEGDVPDGQELRFAASGRVTLGASDVTGSAWSFSGGVFASASAELASKDFVFGPVPDNDPVAARICRFAVTAPIADALDVISTLPHGDPSVGPHRLPLGESYWASFVRVGHFGAGITQPAVPRTSAGRFEQAVFADASVPIGEAPPPAAEPCFELGFDWDEREPFAIRMLLPRRFQQLDDDAGTKLTQPLRLLLDRHRAAGVELRVEYADPRWTLGVGIVRDPIDGDTNPADLSDEGALGVLLEGTELWPDGTPQPGPTA